MGDLINDIIKLERINRELEEIKKPEYIERRAAEIFGAGWVEELTKKLAADVNAIIGG